MSFIFSRGHSPFTKGVRLQLNYYVVSFIYVHLQLLYSRVGEWVQGWVVGGEWFSIVVTHQLKIKHQPTD